MHEDASTTDLNSGALQNGSKTFNQFLFKYVKMFKSGNDQMEIFGLGRLPGGGA